MVEPKIVFCKNNHIFDAAINSECPYCINIAKEQKMLNKLVFEKEATQIEMNGEADETTELIYHSSSIQNTDDEATELINRTSSIQNIEEDDCEATELIDYAGKHRNSYLVGWLVGVEGNQKGRSIEILEGDNYIYIIQGKLILENYSLATERKLGVIYQDRNTKEFYIRPERDVFCEVNNIEISELWILKPYDSVSLQNSKFVFVNLNGEFFEWGI